MNLLERYLAALKPLLPRRTQDDILQEIADEIESQMEERAQALGRALTEGEAADILRKHGHPLVVASRYGQPRYLIDPELFPFYWRTLKVSLVAATAIWVVVIAAALVMSAAPGHELMPLLMRVPGVLITVFGAVTAVFAAAQFSRSFVRLKRQSRWDPRTLPHIERKSAKQTQSAFEAVLGVIGLVWWQLLPSMPFLALGPAAPFLKFGPVWRTLHWPLVILIAAHIVKSVTQFVWPEQTRIHAQVALGLHGAELVVILVAIRAGDWVMPGGSIAVSQQLQPTADALNRGFGIACFVGLLVRTVQFAFRCIRVWHGSSAGSGWRAVSAL